LEVWFSPSQDDLPPTCAPNGLKAVSPEIWNGMLDLVHCKVLSIVESEHVDAYLLSESSMFVFPHKVILKTCGTTTLLYGLTRLLEIAALNAGFPQAKTNLSPGVAAVAAPYRVFYSRKNFLFPNKQQGPHRSWLDEVRFLDKLFLRGSAYLIGKMNGEHWYLYITEPHTEMTPPSSPVDGRGTKTRLLAAPRSSVGLIAGEEEDETLEILMTDLDDTNARQFYLEDASAVAEGRYVKEARKARQDAIHSLGSLQSAGQAITPASDDVEPKYGQFPKKVGFCDAEDDAAFSIFGPPSPVPSDCSLSMSSSMEARTLPDRLATEGHTLGSVVSECSGLADLYPLSQYPDARIDAYLFAPCGFSANGVVPAPGPGLTLPPAAVSVGTSNDQQQQQHKLRRAAHYFTVHVTPEPHCSYASFETNVPARGPDGRGTTADVIERVVRIFRPGRFSVTLFEAKRVFGGSPGPGGVLAAARRRMDSIAGYRRVDRIVHDLDGYELVFRYYEREDWMGGAPRLGEVGF
jgi:S-adenosylmethionine decarboxylase